MKKRILPSGFWALFVGFSFLLFTPLANAGNPGNSATKQSGSGAAAIATDQINQIRANQVTGTINPQDVIKAQEQVKSHAAKSIGAATLNWVPRGPNNAAGRTRAVIFDKNDPTNNTLIAGGVSGGLWTSDNLGLVWKEINTGSNEVLRVSSLIQLPSGKIYAGTGETYCNSGSEIGTGLYRSDDGVNFSVVPGTQPVSNDPNSSWAYIAKLACSTNGRIFAATNTGLMFSDDGNSWTNAIPGYAIDVVVGPDGTVLAAVNNSVYIAVGGDMSNIQNLSTGNLPGLPNTNVGWIQLAIAPSDGNVMYASIAKNTGVLLNIYRSVDKGANWSVIFPGNSTYDPFVGNGCYNNTISVFPTDANHVLLGGKNMWSGKKFDETGYFNWEEISGGDYFAGYPLYVPFSHHAYVFNPGNPNSIIIASDQGLSRGTVASGYITFETIIRNFMVSRMNSVTMSVLKDGVFGGGENIGTQFIPGQNYLNEPMTGTQVWLDNGGGSMGGSGGQVAWSMIAPSVIIYSKQGVDPPWRRSEDFGTTVSPTFMGAIKNSKIPIAPLYLYENLNDLNSFDSISYTAGERLIPADSMLVLPSDNEKFPFRYVTPVVIPKGATVKIQDVVQTRFFVAGANTADGDGLFMTKDALKFSKNPKWFCIAHTPNSLPVSCIDVSKDLNYLWAGTTGGQLFRVSNIANAYDSLTADVNSASCIITTNMFDTIQYPFLKNRYVTSVSVSNDNKKVLITLGNYGNSQYVYYTNNALDPIPTFTAVQGDLPAMPVYCGLFEKDNQNKVIIGTDFGAYSTDNISAGTPLWSAETTGSGNVPVTALKQQTNPGVYYWRPMNYGTIVMASYGRGFFLDSTYRTILSVDPHVIASAGNATVRIEPNPFRDNVNVSFTMTKVSDVKVFVYDISGRIVTSDTWRNVTTGQQTRSINMSSFPAGTYIISVDNGNGKAFGKAIKTQ